MAMRICPQCGTESQAPFCRADGFATVDSARYLPRDLHNREGDVLATRYRLDQAIGRSALGSSYRATDMRLQTAIVVRLLAPGLATDLGLIARFQREGRLVASLAHPNIVHVMEHGVAEDGTLFIAQELVAGPTLAEALARSGPFDPTRVVALGRELFDALSEAHTHGVLHRSLGLDNITLVTRPGGGESLKIGDFGLVHVLADDNAQPFVFPQVLLGAWRGMAPEQARGRGVSGHADLYSVGCLLYELLAGRPVFADGSPSDLLVAHSVKLPPPPDRDGRILAGPLIELVMRCLEKKPWNRPDGAQKALDLLELCRAQPVLPLPNPTAEFAAPPVSASSQRIKPRTNPYGHPSPTSTTTRPTLPAAEAVVAQADPKEAPRPAKEKPARKKPPPEIGPAPQPPSEGPRAGRADAPGASAARAESSDRGFASRADLQRSGRGAGDSGLAPRARSPLLWFAAGMVVAGLTAFAIIELSREPSAVEAQVAGPSARDSGQAATLPSPAGAPPPSPGPTEPRFANALAPAHGAAAADAPPPTAVEPNGAETQAPPPDVALGAGPADVVSAPAPDTLAPVSDAGLPPDSRAAALEVMSPGPDDSRARPRDKAPVDPLADLEDPEFTDARAGGVTQQKVLIDSEPIGAKVVLGGRAIGETPIYVEWRGDGVDVVLKKVGYLPARQRLGPATGRAVKVMLVPAN